MKREYISLEVLCKKENNDKEQKLIYKNGEYSTDYYSDRTFMADEGPLARCEELGVNLLDCDDINNIKLPSNTNEFSLSLARKVLFESKHCRVITTLSRETIVSVNKNNVNNYVSKEDGSLLDALKELAKATRERTIESVNKEPELKLSFK